MIYKQISCAVLMIILFCDFTVHCAINSTDQPNHNNCTLPKHPENGNWSVYDSNTILHPGQQVSSTTILTVKCNKQYKLDSNAFIVCINGKWSSNMGKCLKRCPPIITTPTTKVICTYPNGETIDHCLEPVDGTIARTECAPFYEHRGKRDHKNTVQTCVNGAWDYEITKCVPVCGQKPVQETLLIPEGPKNSFPWHVALYQLGENNKQLICSGTLINLRIILTAAHCVTTSQGNLLPKEKFAVAVGKFYRKYDDARDSNEAQFSELEAMFISEEYTGATQNYFGDIAILVTKKVFILSRKVQPVCVDWELNYESRLVNKSTYGYVTGWGYTYEKDSPSEGLEELKVTALSFEKCSEDLPEDYEKFLTHDKLCAGYLDTGISVYQGDNGGGGLVFKYEGRYYITGILSLSPIFKSEGYGLYTNISKYITKFILPKEAHYRP